MPKATVQHDFEWDIYGGCQRLAERLLGGCDIGCGFTALIGTNGNVIYFISNELKAPIPEELKEKYGELFFDPFDGPVYTFVAWSNCSKSMLGNALSISIRSLEADFPKSGKVMY